MTSSRRLIRFGISSALLGVVLSLVFGCSKQKEESSATQAAGTNAAASAAGNAGQASASPAENPGEPSPSAPAASAEGSSQRRPAPGFTLKDLNGKDVSLAQFRGKVVILDFWATWCPPCRMEIPHFIELQKEYQSKGLEIVGVSLDQKGAETVRPFAQQNGINYTMLVDGLPITGMYGGISGIPTTFVIDKEGRIVQAFVGYNDESVFEGLVKSLLQEG